MSATESVYVTQVVTVRYFDAGHDVALLGHVWRWSRFAVLSLLRNHRR